MKTYQTHDLTTAAFLSEKKFKILSANRINGRTVFTFADPNDKAQTTAAMYLNGASLPAIRFADRLRHLKGIVMHGM